MQVDPLGALNRLKKSPDVNLQETVPFSNNNHISLSDKALITDSITQSAQMAPRNVLMSKILLKKNSPKMVQDAIPKQARKTYMYVGKTHPIHHNGSHHHSPNHHYTPHKKTTIPEGYERCDHGCLCKKGTLHKQQHGGGHNQHHSPGQNLAQSMGMMPPPNMMGAGMMGAGMMGGGMMGGGMGGHPPMGGGMMTPPGYHPPPMANNPMITGLENVGNGVLGTMNQATGVMGQWNNAFNNIAARNLHSHLN
jgi:hypothetical protein